MQTAIIECVGGGGGGGGAANTGSLQTFTGGGGGSGGYSRKYVTAAQIGVSQTVTIGAAGSGGAAGQNNGTAGGDTSVGSLCVAKGGGAGAGAGPTQLGGAGAGGVVGTGDIATGGAPGNGGLSATLSGVTGNVQLVGAFGGSSHFGGGGLAGQSANVVAATGYGSGGGGAQSFNASGTFAGGNGSPGIVIITEYGNVSVGAATGPAKPGELTGLGLTWSSATSLQIAAGCACSDDFTTTMITQGIASKLINAAWAAGTGHGSLDTGAIAASTWYHVFLIWSTSGAVDVLTSLSVATPTLPSGYTKQRRIGSIRTDASSNLVGFFQNGDQFLYTTVPATWDLNGMAGSTTPALATIGTPLGIKTIALLYAQNLQTNNQLLYIRSPDQSTTGVGSSIPNSNNAGGISSGVGQIQVPTNTSSQVNYWSSATSGSGNIYILAYGWIDSRGK